MAASRNRSARGTALALLALAATWVLSTVPGTLFAVLPRSRPLMTPEFAKAGPFAGRSQGPGRASSSNVGTGAAATADLVDFRRWGSAPPSPAERLSPREWTRMFRTLGLEEDASRDRVMRTTSRLRKKYADDEEALERLENANLWIMTKMMSKSEEATRKRQQANRMREFGNTPRKLFQKYVAGYIPPNVRQMFEAPSSKHFRTTSGLLGAFALLGLCVPTQATNFVSLAGAACMGLVYQRSRPEPVKDDMGNVGEVRKINYKEMGATIVVTVLGALLGVGLSVGIVALTDAPFVAMFSLTTCITLWLVALFFKVYQCFDA